MSDGHSPCRRRAARSPALIHVLRAACHDGPRLSITALPERTVRWAVESGLGPLLERAGADDPDAPASPLWPIVRGADLTARFLSAEQIAAMTEILDACQGRVPPPVLLKGISLCDQHYAEPHLRPMRDIDFLMEEEAIPAVESILRRLGYSQWAGRPSAFYARHHHSAPFVHPDTGVWIDVHRALFAAGGELGSDRTFAPVNVATQLRWTEFQGRPVRRLSVELQVVHLACHWARGLRPIGGMVAMADITLLLHRSPDIDWTRILAWTTTSRAARYLCILLTYLERHGLVDVDPGVLVHLSATPTSPGRIALRVAHALLDRYVVDGHDFGVLVSERTFARLWRILVLRQPRGAPPGRRGPPDPAVSERAERNARRPATEQHRRGVTAPIGNAYQRSTGEGKGRTCRGPTVPQAPS